MFVGLAPFLGQVFVRTEPWAGFAAPWVDYLARCSYLLNQGLPAVDVAVFTVKEAPLTALYGDQVRPLRAGRLPGRNPSRRRSARLLVSAQ